MPAKRAIGLSSGMVAMIIGLGAALGGAVGCGADGEEATFSERVSAMRQNNHAPTVDRVEGVPCRRVSCGTKI